MKIINPEDQPEPLNDAARADISALAKRQAAASGVLMKVITSVGGQVESGLSKLPKPVRAQIDKAARSALAQSYEMASRSRNQDANTIAGLASQITGDKAHKVLAAISGALGGLGGLPTALIELPIATTVIFRAVQGVAETHGEDPNSEETRLECLRVFGAGGPGAEDDGVDTSFIGARLSLTGPALNGILRTVAPRFAAVLGQKLATQAVPILGAAAGASTNYAFADYYVEVAHVHFGLRRWAREHGDEAVLGHFHTVLAKGKFPVNRA